MRRLSVSTVDHTQNLRNSLDGRENKISMNDNLGSFDQLNKSIFMRPLSSHKGQSVHHSSFKNILGQSLNNQILTANQQRETRMKSSDARMFKNVLEAKKEHHNNRFFAKA